MAQSIEATEKQVNGITHKTPIVKSYVVANIESHQGVDASGDDDSEIFLRGKGIKDLRRVDQNYAAVLALINAAPSADVEKTVDMVVKKKDGQLEERVTQYNKAIEKDRIVEFWEDLNSIGNSIVVVKKDINRAERVIYYVTNSYAALKASFDA
jgi:hypothetical protein